MKTKYPIKVVYLHEDGTLIQKKVFNADDLKELDESPLVKDWIRVE